MKYGEDPKDGKKDPKEMGSDDDQGDEDNKEGDAQKKEGKEMSKSAEALTGDDLQKSLDKLEELSKSEDGPSRKEELLAKAGEEELTKSENEELYNLLGGGEVNADSAADDIAKSLTDNEPLQKSLDVSSYLQENHDALVKSLSAVGESIEKSDHRRHEFQLTQARAVLDIGRLVKSMSETLSAMVQQPVAGPKSAGVGAQALSKSFGGEPPAEERLSKSDVLNALDGLMEESLTKSDVGRLANGEDISVATAKFESSQQISPYALKQVQRWRKENQASH